jgi:hypothetical protein
MVEGQHTGVLTRQLESEVVLRAGGRSVSMVTLQVNALKKAFR